MTTLHLTNGDSSVSILQKAGVCGDIVPWRDCLHEGPVPEGLSLEAMSDVRVRYLTDGLTLHADKVREDFNERDRRLKHYRNDDEVILWFEHDLYDQLQLLQILHWFAAQDFSDTRLGMICIGEFPGIEAFFGLGQLSPEQMATLAGKQQPVTPKQLRLGRAGWEAFCAPDPTRLEAYLQQDLSCLPFMRSAIERHLEEFPSTHNGLSRTEQQILDILSEQPMNPGKLFHASQEREAARYMGDWSFWKIVADLNQMSRPLLVTESGEPFFYAPVTPWREEFNRQLIQLTDMGRRVLEGSEHRLELGAPDRWLGGVHLCEGHCWCWDRAEVKLFGEFPS